jgi:hypothetical protein
MFRSGMYVCIYVCETNCRLVDHYVRKVLIGIRAYFLPDKCNENLLVHICSCVLATACSKISFSLGMSMLDRQKPGACRMHENHVRTSLRRMHTFRTKLEFA